MKYLMITWTDIFEGLGSFFQWTFKGMRALGQAPNVFLWIFVFCMLAYWCWKIVKYKKEAAKNGTIE